MTIFISVVSHGHSDLIDKLSCLSSLSQAFQVVVKSNKSNDWFECLSFNVNFHWINDQYGCGFGHNNNIVFDYCQSKLGMKKDDFFIVLNPDVVIAVDDVNLLIRQMIEDNSQLSAINLFKDEARLVSDDSVRDFPSLSQFVRSFLGFGNSAIVDKSAIFTACNVDWAAGSFLAVKVEHYANLGGFDEYYFMYCEDIDICYRSYSMGKPLTYYPNITALHLTKHANRKLFSKHFYWHVSSVLRFLLSKAGMTHAKSSLQSNEFVT